LGGALGRIEVDGDNLTIGELVEVARKETEVAIATRASKKIEASRSVLERRLKEGGVVYGVNTGFGDLRSTVISSSRLSELQTNLVRSTSAGVGEAISREETRAIMLLRLNTLAKGYSGVRTEIVHTLASMLNRGVHPVIPSRGSVGASGDLAPLSHMALVMMGEGMAEFKGRRMKGSNAMRRAGIKPVKLMEKEGLALINGTQFMTALGALACFDIEMFVEEYVTIFSLSLEALDGDISSFNMDAMSTRPHPGMLRAAEMINRMFPEGRKEEGKFQDPYTIRCAPQVLSPLIEMLEFTERVVSVEMNSTTDNPIVLEDGNIVSAGNFHGQPVASVLDALCIPLQSASAFSERRTARLVDAKLSGLNPFLTEHPGLESGYMIAQYTAAALVSEGKVLSHPSSSDSIPTSANQEDFVSMGAFAAIKLRQLVSHAYYVLAIEAICAAQALDISGRGRSPKILAALAEIRRCVPHLGHDREVHRDIEKCRQLLLSGALSPGRLKT